LALLLVVVVIAVYGLALFQGAEPGTELLWVGAAVLMAAYLVRASRRYRTSPIRRGTHSPPQVASAHDAGGHAERRHDGSHNSVLA
jgi:hypothetical protein